MKVAYFAGPCIKWLLSLPPKKFALIHVGIIASRKVGFASVGMIIWLWLFDVIWVWIAWVCTQNDTG
jgi:hypothetical protein